MIFDCEANGLLDEVDTVHCISIIDFNTREEFPYRPHEIDTALDHLNTADRIVAHNAYDYDIPMLDKVRGWKPRKGVRVIDTLPLSRLLFANMKELDNDSKSLDIRALSGGHSLSDWAVRLQLPTQKVAHEDWTVFSEEMLHRCVMDTRISVQHYAYLIKQYISEEAFELESRIAWEYAKMRRRGIQFNLDAAGAMLEGITAELERIQQQVDLIVPPVREEHSTPQYWTMTWPDGTTQQFDTKGEAEKERKLRKVKPKDCTLKRGPNRFTLHRFNPGSAQQVREYLVRTYQWVSPKLTDTGAKELRKDPRTSYESLAFEYGSTEEDVLRTLTWPEAKLFADYGMVAKVRSMVAGGKQAWLTNVKDGRLHPRFIHVGCVTHRTSANFMIQQTPSVVLHKETGEPLWGFEGRYGADCRSLFYVPAGRKMVGSDMAGIEGRMLGHYLKRYDKGEYIDHLLNGDIHNLNVDAILTYAKYKVRRGDSKPMYYGHLYGIGDEKQGRVVVDCCEEALQEYQYLTELYEKYPEKIEHFQWVGYGKNKEKIPLRPSTAAFSVIGGKVNTALRRGIKGLDKLVTDVTAAAEKNKYLQILDKRRIPIRKPNAALNTLLQGSSGIVFKRYFVIAGEYVRKYRLDVKPLLVCHDEKQDDVLDDHVEKYVSLLPRAVKEAGEWYNLNIPIAGDVKVGTTWFETH